MSSASTSDPSAFPPVEHLAPPPPSAPAPEPEESADAPALYEGLELHRFTIEQYHRLGESGILGPREPVFLLDGLLVRKMTKHPPHVIASDKLNPSLMRTVPEGWFVSNQNPVIIGPRSEPEPDFKVVRGRPDDYAQGNPGPDSIAVVIEISYSSVRLDQTVMKARYAMAGIPVYWIVNLVARRIEVYSSPTGPDQSPDYLRREDFGPDEAVPLVLDGREVARIQVRDVLPLEQGA